MGGPQQLDGLFHGQFQIIMGALVAGLVHGNSQQSVMDDLQFFSSKWMVANGTSAQNIRTTSWKIRTKIPTKNWTMP
jgi:hypothetical protein